MMFESPFGARVIRIIVHAERAARGTQRKVLPIVSATRKGDQLTDARCVFLLPFGTRMAGAIQEFYSS